MLNRDTLNELISNNLVLLDGATGTELANRGMPAGVSPIQWVMEHPQAIVDLQRDYIHAGSRIVYTNTLGGNRIKLEEYGLGNRVHDINRQMAKLSREAIGSMGYVAGDLGPTGLFIRPFGDLDFEAAVEIYKEQVQGLLEGGVDLFVIETMLDIQETRAAVLAVKEACDLPVLVSMTFQDDGRTLTGTDPVTALITLQSLGADAVGCNCSTGPKDMLEIIKAMKPYAKVPLMAKPNAGLPRLLNGNTVFSMDAREFASYVKPFVECGVNLFGGCCGTSPEYISEMKKAASSFKTIPPTGKSVSVVTSSQKTVFIGADRPVNIVGERINPTGKKKLQEELRQGKTFEVRRFAMEQIEAGAAILDVNVGMPGIDEKETMVKLVEQLSTTVDAPLCIDSSNPEVIEAALRIYPGRALINSISAERTKVDKLIPLAAKYGAMFILLPLSDDGIPSTAEERSVLVEKVYHESTKYGYTKADIVVDGLVMTVSSDQKAARETLKLLDWAAHHFGCNTIIGLSNVSFGLPERSWVNSAFLSMAIGSGLTMAIANPSIDILMNIKLASDVLMATDVNSRNYIRMFSPKTEISKPVVDTNPTESITEQMYKAVVKGDREGIVPLVVSALQEGFEPAGLVDKTLIPAINHVGDLYDRKKYFLPQLIQSAEAMKAAFSHIEPLLVKADQASMDRRVKIILATVKGDIHDIGKNIVALMLKNHSFQVIDLGKDVSARDIVDIARKNNAQLIGLSALMTTTMMEMKEVISLARKEGLHCKFMIGGAVVNQQFADEIKADGYASDANDAVRLAKKLSQDL